MKFKLFGKPKCPACRKAKRAIKKAGYEIEEHDAEYHGELHDGWKDNHDNSIDFKAALAMDGQLALPVIFVDEGEGWNQISVEEVLKCV